MNDIYVTRRGFMRGTGAAALAVACSGLLTACSGDSSANSSNKSYTIGEYSVSFKSPSFGWVDSDEEGYIIPEVKIKGLSNSITIAKFYADMFDATAGGENLKLENSITLGNFVQGISVSCLPKFTTKDKELYDSLKSGEVTMELSITLSAVTKTFIINLKDKTTTLKEESE